MMSPEQVREYTFERAKPGAYRSEDVDRFQKEVLHSYEQIYRENGELMRKLQVLADKVEEYRGKEESIGAAMMSAFEIRDKNENEAKQMAKKLLEDAKSEADRLLIEAREGSEEIIREAKQQSDNLIGGIRHEVAQESATLDAIKREVGNFKVRLVSIYKEHIQLINSLPAVNEEFSETARPGADAGISPKADMSKPPAGGPNTPEASSKEKQTGGKLPLKDEQTESKYKDLKFGMNYDINNDK